MENIMKKYDKVIINGRFLTQKITGVQRYAQEVVKALDTLINQFPIPIELIVPETCTKNLNLTRIIMIKYGKHSGIIWEQTDLATYIRHNNGLGLHLCNSVPLIAPKGIICIHDITYKLNPQYIITKHLISAKLWHLLQYFISTKYALHLTTVSHYSQQEICREYKIPIEKITVAYNGWQHFNTEISGPDSLAEYPYLKEDEYFFSLSTIAKNKNFPWLIQAAKKNPKNIFAVAGTIDEKKLGNIFESPLPQNIKLLGYISDNTAKILMKHCRAFIFPSLYEGFGIPPLEALAMGAAVICSNTTCLPEIFENCVHYIDPYNPNVSLETILEQPVQPAKIILDKYSWKKTARIYKHILETYI